MAELPEVHGTRLPDRRPLYDRPASFGAAADAERMRQGVPPPPIRRAPPRTTRLGWPVRPPVYDGRRWRHLPRLGGAGDRGLADLWHRLLCRRGRHEFRGGGAMQLGSNVVYVERRCVWCDARPF